MKICTISILYPRESKPAFGNMVFNKDQELARQGHSVYALTTGEPSMKSEEVINGVNIKRIVLCSDITSLRCGILFSLKCAKELIRLNKKLDFDVVHSHFVGIVTIAIGFVCRFVIKKPFVLTSHGTSWEMPKKNILQNFLIKLSLLFPNRIIAVSRATKELLGYNTNKDKIAIIPSGVNVFNMKPTASKNSFKKKLNISNKKVLLTVCNLVEKKGVDVIVSVIPNLVKKFPNLIYIIIGEGQEKQKLVDLVKKLNIQEHVMFEGYKKGRELANFYNICDIFVLMSRTTKEGIESLGVVYIEASYFGKPVIGGKGGGTSDAIEDGKSGYLVDANNPEELERKLEYLLKNPSARKRMGEYGRKRAIKLFLWESLARKIVGVYKEAIRDF